MKIQSEVFEVADRVIVKVTQETGDGSSTQAVAEVGDGTVDDAYQKALKATGVKLSPAPAVKQVPAKADFPDPDEVDKIPEPTAPKALGKQPVVSAVRDAEAIETKPRKVPGKVSPGLIMALKDACESERVPFQEPGSDDQAGEWIRGIRENGWTELPDPEIEEAANG